MPFSIAPAELTLAQDDYADGYNTYTANNFQYECEGSGSTFLDEGNSRLLIEKDYHSDGAAPDATYQPDYDWTG